MLKGSGKAVAAENVRTLKHSGMSERDAVMTSLKNEKKASKSKNAMVSPSMDHEDYPYSSRLDFEHETLGKLGIKKLPKHGSAVSVHAKGTVHSTSENTDSDGKQRRRMTVQLTHMKLSGGKDDGDSDDQK